MAARTTLAPVILTVGSVSSCRSMKLTNSFSRSFNTCSTRPEKGRDGRRGHAEDLFSRTSREHAQRCLLVGRRAAFSSTGQMQVISACTFSWQHVVASLGVGIWADMFSGVAKVVFRPQKMNTLFIKKLVSGNRRRLKTEDGYNLDMCESEFAERPRPRA